MDKYQLRVDKRFYGAICWFRRTPPFNDEGMSLGDDFTSPNPSTCWVPHRRGLSKAHARKRAQKAICNIEERKLIHERKMKEVTKKVSEFDPLIECPKLTSS